MASRSSTATAAYPGCAGTQGHRDQVQAAEAFQQHDVERGHPLLARAAAARTGSGTPALWKARTPLAQHRGEFANDRRAPLHLPVDVLPPMARDGLLGQFLGPADFLERWPAIIAHAVVEHDVERIQAEEVRLVTFDDLARDVQDLLAAR